MSSSKLAILDRYIEEADRRIAVLRANIEKRGPNASDSRKALALLDKLCAAQTERRALRAKLVEERR